MNTSFFSAWTLLKICWTVFTAVLRTLSGLNQYNVQSNIANHAIIVATLVIRRRLEDRLLAVVSESPQTDAKHKTTFDWLESRVSLDGLVENSSGSGANSHSRISDYSRI